MEDEIDELTAQLQAKLNKEINSMYLPILKTLEDIKSQPQTVCLVYMTEQHDGGQASYCEVYKDEDTAVKSLLSRGYTHLNLSGTYGVGGATAEVVDEVRVR